MQRRLRRYTTDNRLDSWIQKQCKSCGRFLFKFEIKYCRRCYRRIHKEQTQKFHKKDWRTESGKKASQLRHRAWNKKHKEDEETRKWILYRFGSGFKFLEGKKR